MTWLMTSATWRWPPGFTVEQAAGDERWQDQAQDLLEEAAKSAARFVQRFLDFLRAEGGQFWLAPSHIEPSTTWLAFLLFVEAILGGAALGLCLIGTYLPIFAIAGAVKAE